jgi:hypothetical protein
MYTLRFFFAFLSLVKLNLKLLRRHVNKEQKEKEKHAVKYYDKN